MSQATKTEILADAKRVQDLKPEVPLTRDWYAQHGEYSKHAVLKHWPTFKALVSEVHDSSVVATDVTHEETKDKWSLSLKKTRIHTLEQLIAHFEVDLSIWEIERFRCNKWEMPYTVGQGETRYAKVEPVYQVRADFKKRKSIAAIKAEIDDLIEFATSLLKEKPEKQTIYREQEITHNLFEVNIPDVHFGKLAWSGETGFGNYDTKIAEAVYERAVDALIFRSKSYRFDRILFVVGNDLLNSDDAENQTTSGTVVTTDGRYQKTFRVARRAVIRAIEKLRALAPVDVVVVPGNHDSLSVWHLGESLKIYFDRYSDVTVDNEPTPRKFYQWGQVGIMLCHGHKGKRNDYPLQFATERPDIFGSTKFREVHTGHTHQTKLDEQHGVRVRVLPALCEPDDWHSENGYTGNLRNAEGFVWSKTEGLVSMVFYNDDSQAKINTKTIVV